MSRISRRARILAVLTLGVAVSAGATSAPSASGQAAGDTESVATATMVSSNDGTVSIAIGAARGGVSPAYEGDRVEGETVSPPDGRSRVLYPQNFPNRAVGQLEYRQGPGPNNNFICTAWLVDENTVLTAGHCVVEGGGTGVPEWSTEMTFTPGRQRINGSVVDPYGSCGTTELYSPPQYVDNADEAYDWGLVQLDCTIGDEVGWLGYFSLPGVHALRNKDAVLQGYPGDKRFGSYWKDPGQIIDSSPRMAFYSMDTFGGQSGSPVWRDKAGCGPCGMAIHAYGYPHSTGLHRTANHGPRITATRYDVITDLADDNNAP